MNNLTKDIIQEWGLTGLPEEKQVEIIDRVSRLVYQAILVRSLDILSDDEQTEFDTLLDEDSTTPQEVLEFLAEKIPTFDQLLREERDNIRNEILTPLYA